MEEASSSISPVTNFKVDLLSDQNVPVGFKESQLVEIAKKIRLGASTTVSNLGLATEPSVVAVENTQYESWCTELLHHNGINIEFHDGPSFRLVNTTLIKNSLETFDTAGFREVGHIFHPTYEENTESVRRHKIATQDVLEPEKYSEDIRKYFEDLVVKLDNPIKLAAALAKFALPNYPNVVFCEAAPFRPILRTFTSNSSIIRRVEILDFKDRCANIYCIRKGSPLLETKTESFEMKNRRSELVFGDLFAHAINDSFIGVYKEKASNISSLLNYISRHYYISKLNEGMPYSYYSPLVCLHQSSGAGKSRLSAEVSLFILPIVLSGPNETGLPKESDDLRRFKEFILGLKMPHTSLLMTLTFNFILRVSYLGIKKELEDLGCKISGEGKILEWNDNRADEVFTKPITPNYLTDDVLSGFQDYAEKYRGSKRIGGINIPKPKNTIFPTIDFAGQGGAIKSEMLTNLLMDLRAKRVKYLSTKRKRAESEKEIDWLPHVIFVFDEAQHLLKGKTGTANQIECQDFEISNFAKNRPFQTDPYRMIRRTLGHTNLFWEYIWGAAISTNSAIANFSPKVEDDPSLRGRTDIKLIPPFVLHETFDVFAAEYCHITHNTNGNGKVVNNGALDYITSWKRIGDIISCGRPLFYSFVEAAMNSEGADGWRKQLKGKDNLDGWGEDIRKTLSSLFQMISNKANGGKLGPLMTEDSFKIESIEILYTLFSSSIGLYGCPSVVDKGELVRKHMAWITEYNMENDYLRIKYPSEGAFNCFLGYALYKKFDQFLAQNPERISNTLTFFARPATQQAFSSWQVTEILSRLLFVFGLHATPSIEEERAETERLKLPNNLQAATVFFPRKVKDLLKTFAPIDPDLSAEDNKERAEQFSKVIDGFFNCLGSEYAECVTAFGYFHECIEANSPLESSKAMLFRGAARYFKKEHRGADLMLPLVMKDGRYGCILIQVKGIRENILESDATLNYMKNCDLAGVFGFVTNDKRLRKDTKEQRTKEKREYEDFPTIRILLNLKQFQGRSLNGASVYEEVYTEDGREKKDYFLAIQNDGNFGFLQENVRSFFKSAIRIAEDTATEMMPKLNNYRRDPPRSYAHYPFNPVYRNITNDSDKVITSDHGRHKMSSRPKYLNIQ